MFINIDSTPNANFAVCVNPHHDPLTAVLHKCDDTSPNSCGGAGVVEPFLPCTKTGSKIVCNIDKVYFGGFMETLHLTNACSYDLDGNYDQTLKCDDCIFEGGFIAINKRAYDENGILLPSGSPQEFNFQVTGNTGFTEEASVFGSGSVVIGVPAGSYDLFENLPPRWLVNDVSCINTLAVHEGSISSSKQLISKLEIPLATGLLCLFENREISSALPSLYIEKTADLTSYSAVGEVINYQYQVTNTGSSSYKLINVGDDKICHSGISEYCISCPLSGTLNPGNSVACEAVSYVVTQDDIDLGYIKNIAQARDQGLGGLSNEVQHFIDTIQIQSISLNKQGIFNDENGNGLAEAGETISYVFTLSNYGNTTQIISSFTDPLIPDLMLNCSPNSFPVTLLPGDTLDCTGNYTLSVHDLDPGYMINTATACFSPPEYDI